MLRALIIGSLAAMGGLGTTTVTAQDQRADPGFDTKVAAPAYTSRHPAVLFDEAHRNFHTAGGLYKPFADLIGHDGYRVESNKKPLARELLGGYEILIIANAEGAKEERPRTRPAPAKAVDVADAAVEDEERQVEVEGEGQLVTLADVPGPPGVEGETPRPAGPACRDAECKVVASWVKSGGSLLLITDMNHWGAAARNLADRFGVEMSQGVTIDPKNSVAGKPAWLIFTGQNGLLGDHPITSGRDPSERINRVATYVGQSLLGPPGSVPFLRLSGTAIDRNPDGTRVGEAGRCQGLALTHGKGRVVVLGEARAPRPRSAPRGRSA